MASDNAAAFTECKQKNTKWWLVEFCNGFRHWYIVPHNSNLYKILGENIRVERTRMGLTQERLAEKAGLARNYIGNVERAENRITLEALYRIAQALKVRIRDLVDDI